MELEFEKSKILCLKPVLSVTKDMELTQEVKLSEQMPDVGNILGAWGQVLIRGKEWRSNSIGVQGGVMCWVMYMPEDQEQPQVVEGWMPFQTQMDIPDGVEDGQICVLPALKMVDARNISAGKILVRACISMQIKAHRPMTALIHTAPKLPDHIQLLKKGYQMNIPCEAGEKAFQMDETFSVEGPVPEKLLRYELQPVITEKKVMAGKLVFRGGALVQGLYMAEGRIHSFRMDIPFAQYMELERELDPEATAWICPVVTGLELELAGERDIQMKAGIAAQYVICDKMEVSLTEDAYSTQHALQIHTQPLEAPMILEEKQQQIYADFGQQDRGRLVDAVCYWDQPRLSHGQEGGAWLLSGRYQTLFYDQDGYLNTQTGKWEQSLPGNQEENIDVDMWLLPVSATTAGGAELMCQKVVWRTGDRESIAALTVSDEPIASADRPSLILRRKGQDSLWQIAKDTGSTVEKIKAANGLEEEPAVDKMLLIPI